MSLLPELSLSPDGERLVVRNRGDSADNDDDNDTSRDPAASAHGITTDQVGGGGNDGVLRRAAPSTSFPTLGLFSSSRSPPRPAGTRQPAAVTSSSSVPLIPRRHVALLMRRGSSSGRNYSGVGNGDCGTSHRHKVSLLTLNPFDPQRKPLIYEVHY